MKKLLSFIIALALMATLFTTALAEDYEVVVIPKDATNPWFVRMEAGVNEYAKETGRNVYQKGTPTIDATLQYQLVLDMVAAGVDAICVVPVDPSSLEPALKKAREAGIVVVTHEGGDMENIDYDIEAFDNEQFGAFIMDSLAKAMGEEGVYTTMVAHVTNATHNIWADGAIKRQKEAYPKMTLLEAEPRVESEDNGDVAYNTAKEIFKKYPELKGVLGTSSFDAPGVARAIEELGLTGKAFTAGTGVPSNNAALLKSGAIQAVTTWDPALAGKAMAEIAYRLLNKEEITFPLNLGIPGYENVQPNPNFKKVLEGQAYIEVTKDNVDSIGF